MVSFDERQANTAVFPISSFSTLGVILLLSPTIKISIYLLINDVFSNAYYNARRNIMCARENNLEVNVALGEVKCSEERKGYNCTKNVCYIAIKNHVST